MVLSATVLSEGRWSVDRRLWNHNILQGTVNCMAAGRWPQPVPSIWEVPKGHRSHLQLSLHPTVPFISISLWPNVNTSWFSFLVDVVSVASPQKSCPQKSCLMASTGPKDWPQFPPRLEACLEEVNDYCDSEPTGALWAGDSFMSALGWCGVSQSTVQTAEQLLPCRAGRTVKTCTTPVALAATRTVKHIQDSLSPPPPPPKGLRQSTTWTSLHTSQKSAIQQDQIWAVQYRRMVHVQKF